MIVHFFSVSFLVSVFYIIIHRFFLDKCNKLMGQWSAWEGNNSSASWEFPPFAWDIKVYYHIHKVTPTHMLTWSHIKIIGNRFCAHVFIWCFMCMGEQFTPVCKKVKFMILCKEWAGGLYIFQGMWKCSVILFLLLFLQYFRFQQVIYLTTSFFAHGWLVLCYM
jgi:hypothetical protein